VLKDQMEIKGFINFQNSWVTWNMSPQKYHTFISSLWNVSPCDNQTYQRNFVAIEISESSGGNEIMGQ
jgi:hypothetical protein